MADLSAGAAAELHTVLRAHRLLPAHRQQLRSSKRYLIALPSTHNATARHLYPSLQYEVTIRQAVEWDGSSIVITTTVDHFQALAEPHAWYASTGDGHLDLTSETIRSHKSEWELYVPPRWPPGAAAAPPQGSSALRAAWQAGCPAAFPPLQMPRQTHPHAMMSAPRQSVGSSTQRSPPASVWRMQTHILNHHSSKCTESCWVEKIILQTACRTKVFIPAESQKEL